MGIDSREYLRDGDDYGQPQPQSPMSMVTKIIIVTVVVFILQVLSSDAHGQSEIFNRWFILRSDGLFSGHVWKSTVIKPTTVMPLDVVRQGPVNLLLSGR